MATVTHLGTATWTTAGGTQTVTATPNLNDLIVIVAPCTLAGGTISVSDNNTDGNGAYVKVGSSFTGFSTAGDLSIWVRKTLIGSASSTVFTATQTASTGGGLDVFNVSGMNLTGTSVTRGSAGQSAGTSGTTPAPVLPRAPLTTNPIIGSACCGTNATTNFTPPASFAEASDLGYNTPATGMETVFSSSGITSATITWGSTAPSAFASMVVELNSGPLNNGPVFHQAVKPAKAQLPQLQSAYSQGRAGHIFNGNAQGGQASFGSRGIVWNQGAPVRNPISGPPVSWGNPAGIRVTLVRAGSCMASFAPAGPPVSNPAPFRQADRPARAPIPATFSKGRVYSNPGGPVRNPQPGPPFEQADTSAQARILPPKRGRTYASTLQTAVVPVTPAPFNQADTPARAVILPPRRGRIASSPGAPVRNPVAGPPLTWGGPAGVRVTLVRAGIVRRNPGGPVANPAGLGFRQATAPVRAHIPQAFSKGRVYSSPGGPVRNPVAGPVFTQKPRPVRAQRPLPAKGRVYVTAKPFAAAVNAGPPFIQKPYPVQAQDPLPRKGRVYGISQGAPVRNPVPGPPFRQAASPIRARVPQNAPRGRTQANKGAPPPLITLGPPFFPRTSPVRAQQPLPPAGRVYGISQGGPVQNTFPNVIAVLGAVGGAVRAALPATFRGGKIASNPGTFSPSPASGPPLGWGNPAGIRAVVVRAGVAMATKVTPLPAVFTGPPFYPVTHEIRSRFPQQPFLKGRASSSTGAPVRNPQPGPVFHPAVQPVQARIPQIWSKGRVYSSPGAPVRNPQPGPVFRQATSPARIRPSLPPRGRIASNIGAPVVFEVTGPPFRPLDWPARARVPQNAPRGRVYSGKGAPLRNPQSGPVFRQADQPSRARIPQAWSKGRASGNPGGPVLNPPAPVYPLQRPVRIHPVLPPRGRISSSAGIPVPHPAPVYPLGRPVRVHPVLPPRGRIASNPGVLPPKPAAPAPVYPLRGPVAARQPLPPRGRVSGNPGAPVRNPQRGPRFIQADQPVRVRIPQNAPRGRTSSNPGGPVANIPFSVLRFRTGTPYFQWVTGTPGFQWDTGEPGFEYPAGTLAFQWDTGEPGFQWVTGQPQAG